MRLNSKFGKGKPNNPIRLALLLILIIFTASTQSAVYSQTAASGVRLDVAANPSQVQPGTPVDVMLTLTGNGQACEKEEIYRPLRVALVLDRSGSMDEPLGNQGSGTKIEAAIAAVQTFLGLLNPSKDQASLSSFGANSGLDHEMGIPAETSKNLATEFSKIDSGGTNIQAGLEVAYPTINNSISSEVSGVVILLTDGGETNGDSRMVAEKMKNEGIRIVTVGVGPDVDEAVLRSIASKPSDYYYAPAAADLQGIYKSIAYQIKEYDPATDIELTYSFDASNFQLVEDSVAPQGAIQANNITWKFPRLISNQQEVHLKLIPANAGTYNAVLKTAITYRRCGHDLVTDSPSSQFLVKVMGDIVTPMCTPLASTGISQVSWCSLAPWGLIAGLLILLILLLWFFYKNREDIRSWMRCGIIPTACFWARLPLILASAILIGTLTQSIVSGICAPKEGLLFWRIYPDRTSAIYLQPFDNQPSVPVTPRAGQENCVGCHVASNTRQTFTAISGGTNGRVVEYSYGGKNKPLPDIQGSYPAYSPDGQYLAYSANNQDIYILNTLTGLAKPLEGASEPGVIESMPAWSADGTRIVFVRAAGANQSSTITTPSDILSIPSGGGTPMLVTGASSYGYNYHPAFSPDGKWLAFVHHETGTTTYGDPKAEIYLVPAEGGAPRRLVVNDGPGGQPLVDAGNTWPVWSGDSSKLYFSSRRCNNQYDIYWTTISANGEAGPATRLDSISDPEAYEYGAQEIKINSSIPMNILLSILPWLIPWLLLLGLNAWLCKRKSDPLADTLRFHLMPPEPSEGRLNRQQRFKVVTEMLGIEVKERRARPQAVDAVLLMDCSGSMSLPAGLFQTRLTRVRRAAKRFIRCFMSPTERLAIVTFGETPTVIQPIATDEKSLVKALDRMKPTEGSTVISSGLDTACSALSVDMRRRSQRVIVLFTDGIPTESYEEVITAAERAKSDGIRIIAIGTAGADSQLLQKLVNNPIDFHFVNDTRGLENTFLNISRALLKPVAATGVVYVHRYDKDRFELERTTIQPEPEDVDEAEGEITWHIDEVDQRAIYFEYKVRPLVVGQFDIVKPGSVKYDLAGLGVQRNFDTPGGANVIVKKHIKKPGREINFPPVLIQRPKPVWQPESALFIGVGTSGRWVLTHLLDNFMNAGSGELPRGIEFLVLDTNEHQTVQVGQTTSISVAGVALHPESIYVVDENLTETVKTWAETNENRPEHAGWFRPNEFSSLGGQLNLAEGTYSRRAIPRVALLRNIQKQDGIRSNWIEERKKADKPIDLREILMDRCKRVLPKTGQQPHVHIFLVGSLAGGMSGVIADLTTLVRQVATEAAGPDGVVRLEGYLIDGMVVGGFTEIGMPNIMERRANSIASLREIARLQMNPGYSMTLGTSQSSVPLFDDILMFSQEASPDLALKGYPAAQSKQLGKDVLENFVYPTIADVLTLRLDRALDVAALAAYFNAMRAECVNQQNAQHEFMINSAGIYTIQIPTATLLRSLHVRWVYELLRAFLTGNPEQSILVEGDGLHQPIIYDPNNTGDMETVSPQDLSRAFLSGALDDSAPVASRALADYLEHGNSELIGSQILDDYLYLNQERQERDQMTRLAELLRDILTGVEQGSRAGRVAYALKVLECLENELMGIRQQLLSANLDRLEAYTRLVIRAIQNQKMNLCELRDLISQNRSGQPLGIWERITQLAVRLENISSELDRITNRQYVWGYKKLRQDGTIENMLFRNEWWQRYLQGRTGGYLDTLRWIINSDHYLDLGVCFQENNSSQSVVNLRQHGMEAFLDALMRVASSLTVGVYDSLSLQTLLHDDTSVLSAELGGVAGKNSLPLCGEAQGSSQSAPDMLMIVAPAGLENQLDWDMPFGIELYRGASLHNLVAVEKRQHAGSNPVCAAFLHLRNAIPAQTVPGYQVCKSDYDLTDGYNSSLRRFGSGSIHIRAVYQPEALAREIELTVYRTSIGYSPLVNYSQSGTLHPYVVAGLQYPGQAEAYLMAFAEGRIIQSADGRVEMKVPGATPLVLVERPVVRLDPYVEGYLNWCYRISSTKDGESALNILRQHYVINNPSLDTEEMRKWLKGPCDPLLIGLPDRQSLGVLVSAMVRSFNSIKHLRWL